jgi:hypothetical protein
VTLANSALDLEEFKARTVMPAEDVDDLERSYDGFIARRLVIATSRIYTRLRKRYAVPFATPVPEIVLGWIVAIVTVEAYQKRGWNPSDEQSQQILEAATTALAEVKEAADSNEGLFDLPLRQDTTAEGISKGGPFFYSESSPFDWLDVQREAVRGR